MILRLALPLALTCACAAPAIAPHAAGAPLEDARSLLREAVGVLRTRPLGRERVDWDAFLAEYEPTLAPGAAPSSAHEAIALAVDRLADAHARFQPAAPLAQSPAAEPAPTAAPPPQAPPPIPALPEGHWREDRIAWLLLPPCFRGDPASLQAYAAALHGTILELEQLRPRGWILDLRLDGGGNVWPMLLGLRPLLGDGACAGSVDGNGRWTLSLTGAAVWLQSDRDAVPVEQMRLAVAQDAPLARAAPIAVLTGPWTMSSGELVALAFAGDARARRFGEPTAGLTTATEPFPLFDGSTLILPTSWMTDRSGWAPRGSLAPQESVTWGDWPRRDDAAVDRAAAWLLQRDG